LQVHNAELKGKAEETRMDISWRSANLAAMLSLLIVASGILAWQSLQSTVNATEEIPINPARVAMGLDRIDPNTASYASLRRMPGMGPVKAQAIVNWREQHKDFTFRKADDLRQIRGIGPVLSAKMAPHMDLPSKNQPDDADDDSTWQDDPIQP
jgi:competence protein ComEA